MAQPVGWDNRYTGGPTLTGQYPGADAAASAALGMVGHTINSNPAPPVASFNPPQHQTTGPGQGRAYTEAELMAMSASSKAEIAAAKMAQLGEATEQAKLANREAAVAGCLLGGYNRRVEQLAELGPLPMPTGSRQQSPTNSTGDLSEPPTGSIHWELKPADQQRREEGITIFHPNAPPATDTTLAGST